MVKLILSFGCFNCLLFGMSGISDVEALQLPTLADKCSNLCKTSTIVFKVVNSQNECTGLTFVPCPTDINGSGFEKIQLQTYIDFRMWWRTWVFVEQLFMIHICELWANQVSLLCLEWHIGSLKAIVILSPSQSNFSLSHDEIKLYVHHKILLPFPNILVHW